MFLRHREKSGGETGTSRLTALRDIVEIVAIVAAGGWAFYTFVYQNDIKPANSPPLIQFDGKMTRLGQRAGLVAVQSRFSIRNDGVTDVWLYGFAETVLGSRIRVRPLAQHSPFDPSVAQTELEPGWITDRPARVYAIGVLTDLARPHSGTEINLTPGQSLPFDRLFYVPAGTYDELELHVSFRFTAHPKPVPFRLAMVGNLVEIVPSTAADDSDGAQGTIATLSLW
jgi:hypothetical protein